MLPLNEIIRLNTVGYSQREIAAQLGSKQSTISKLCKRKGIMLFRNYHRGAKCHNFKGYKTHDQRGCPVVKNSGKYIREHRLVAKEILGREPTADELVHHINGDITDNRKENIQIVTRSKHKQLHPEIGMDTRFGGIRDPRRI